MLFEIFFFLCTLQSNFLVILVNRNVKSGELGEVEPLLFEVELNPLGDDEWATVAGRVTQLCCSTCLSEPALQAMRMHGDIVLKQDSEFLLEEGLSHVAFITTGVIFNYFVLGLVHLQ